MHYDVAAIPFAEIAVPFKRNLCVIQFDAVVLRNRLHDSSETFTAWKSSMPT